jgi:hypothetical protein
MCGAVWYFPSMAQCGELSITPLAMICGLWNVALTSLSRTTKKMKKFAK